MNLFKKNKTTVSALIGTALEYYDMSLYGLMAPILVSIFLPTFNKLDALILTFIMTPLSIVVRPLGALVIGKIGDKRGRKNALIISITGMSIVTGMIALIPTYDKIGYLAPILFIICRSLQGFFLAGEYNGGAVFMLEHNKQYGKGFLSSLYNTYTLIGILCATVVVTIISYLPTEYWRLPYALGFITGVWGIYIRKNTTESPAFLKYKNVDPVIIRSTFKKYKLVFIAIAVSGFLSALCSLPTIFMNSFLPIATSFSLSSIMAINTGCTLLHMILLPLFGYLADKISFNKSMRMASITICILTYPLISLISLNNINYIIVMKICFAILTAWYIAPFHAWIQSLFHAKTRYSAISLSYSIGSQLGGIMGPFSLWMWKHTQSMAAIYSIIIFWSAVSIISLYMQRNETKYS